MDKKTIIAVMAIVAAFVGLAVFSSIFNKAPDYSQYKLDRIQSLADQIKKEDLNPDSIYEASELTSNLPEKTMGDPKTAKVVLYEYADYACSHCAEWSEYLDKTVKESDGKLAVVYRGYLLPSFKNSVVAASAATAAQMQGYWQEYKGQLFANQVRWYNASGNTLKDELVSYFEAASDGKGDTEKFLADMESETVAKRLAFEYRLGKEIDLKGTPTFRLNGENIEITDLKATLATELGKY